MQRHTFLAEQHLEALKDQLPVMGALKLFEA